LQGSGLVRLDVPCASHGVMPTPTGDMFGFFPARKNQCYRTKPAARNRAVTTAIRAGVTDSRYNSRTDCMTKGNPLAG
jgi:hypothetical protein